MRRADRRGLEWSIAELLIRAERAEKLKGYQIRYDMIMNIRRDGWMSGRCVASQGSQAVIQFC